MAVYFTLYFLLICCAIYTWNKNSTILFYIFSVILLFILGFRSLSVGVDTKYYVSYFLNPTYGYGNDTRSFETGYLIWNDILRFFQINGTVYIFLTAFLSLIGVFYFVKKNSPYFAMSLLLFALIQNCYFYHFFLLRQSIAISLFLIGLSIFNAQEKKANWKSLIFFFLAISFHTTSIIAVALVYIFNKIKISLKGAYIILIASLILGNKFIFDTRDIISSINTSLGDLMLLSRLANYNEFIADNEIMLSSVQIFMRMLPMTILCLVAYQNLINEKKHELYLKLLLIGVAMSNFAFEFMLIGRQSIYFTILIIILLPAALYKKNRNSIIIYIFVIIFFLRAAYTLFDADLKKESDFQITPYKSVLFE